MTPRVMDRLTRLEAEAAPPSAGKHLVFQVEAPSRTPLSDIIAFLKARRHAIHDGDDAFVMNVGASRMAEGEPPRDLSPAILTEEARAQAGAAGLWPKTCAAFTFQLDWPRNVQ
ncbi:hypothetical protein MKK70_08005 [Methylobacterium sp. E-041]|jgi:hypothetical protein|uniref:hypothetical protein n=1 Tax=unclassified Methylobacterium TaxID=2615210 RepID=UPI001FBAC75B|nr:hypothetical protein [Methylobacterium sp. E-041]MCJ2105327.1 hypothetical protein [Methylobacterium sp. E-041]